MVTAKYYMWMMVRFRFRLHCINKSSATPIRLDKPNTCDCTQHTFSKEHRQPITSDWPWHQTDFNISINKDMSASTQTCLHFTMQKSTSPALLLDGVSVIASLRYTARIKYVRMVFVKETGKNCTDYIYLGMRHPIDFIVMSENVYFYDGNRICYAKQNE